MKNEHFSCTSFSDTSLFILIKNIFYKKIELIIKQIIIIFEINICHEKVKCNFIYAIHIFCSSIIFLLSINLKNYIINFL